MTVANSSSGGTRLPRLGGDVKRFGVLVLWGVLLALVAIGRESSAQLDAVRIGLLLPLTGSGASVGQPALQGAILAAEEINARGGFRIGGRRRRVELVPGDDRTIPAGSSAAAAFLIDTALVHALAGGLVSDPTLASEPVIAASRLPYLINGVASPQATRRRDIDTRAIFHYNEIGPLDGQRMADFLAEEVRPRVAAGRDLKVAVLYQDTPLGRDVLEGLPGLGLVGWARGQSLPLDFVALVPFPAGTSNFRPLLAGVAQTQPDVVVPLALEAETIAIIRQGILDVGIHALWGPAFKGAETPGYYQALGDQGPFSTLLTNFTIFDTPAGQAGEPLTTFRQAYQARWGQVANRHAASQYDSLYIFRRVFEKAGTLRKADLRAAFERLNMPALTLPVLDHRIRFDQFHEIRFDLFATQLYRDPANGQNRGRIVWPPPLATAEFQLPPG